MYSLALFLHFLQFLMGEWTPNRPTAVWGHVSQPRQETTFRNSKQSNCSSFGYWLVSLQHLFKHPSFTFQQTGVFSPALQPLRVSLLTERGACVTRESPKRVQSGSLPSMKSEAGSTAAQGSAGEGAGGQLVQDPACGPRTTSPCVAVTFAKHQPGQELCTSSTHPVPFLSVP